MHSVLTIVVSFTPPSISIFKNQAESLKC